MEQKDFEELKRQEKYKERAKKEYDFDQTNSDGDTEYLRKVQRHTDTKRRAYSKGYMNGEEETTEFICEFLKKHLMEFIYVYEGEAGIGMYEFLKQIRKQVKDRKLL